MVMGLHRDEVEVSISPFQEITLHLVKLWSEGPF